MKKLYTLTLVLFGSVAMFAQTFYSESFGTPPAGNPTFTVYATGTPPATFDNAAPIIYSGTGDVRTTSASSGYTGATGSGNAFMGTTAGVGKFMQIDGLDTSAYDTADIVLSFGYLTAGTNGIPTGQLILEQSTDGANWTPIVYTPNPTTSWTLVTTGGIASSSTLSLRFTNPGGTAQIRIDDIALSEGSVTPPLCTLLFGTATKDCDTETAGTDTYTVTIPFTGGGTETYTLNADSGTISGNNPNIEIAGNIIISGIQEGTALAFTAVGGDCDLTVNVTSPNCVAPPATVTLPYVNQFDYPAGQTLTAQQNWGVLPNGSGDDIAIASGNLSYTGLSEYGNSISFSAGGYDNVIEFTPQTTGTVYYSYAINVASLPASPGDDANGGYLSGFGETGTTLGGTVWIKKVDDNNFNFGIEVRTANGTNTTWSTDSYPIGLTHFVVVGYMFGTDGTDDDMTDLWINPTVDGAQDAPDVMDAHVGGTQVDLTEINRFFFRQDSATETGSYQIDALRIGTTWEDVTANTLSIKDNSIAGLKVYPNPVSNGTFFIETAANGEKAVVVYDVLGKQVLNTMTTSTAVNVSNLTGGVYIVKITEGGNTATRKMVIK
jgi:type IX secretion system substrate protein